MRKCIKILQSFLSKVDSFIQWTKKWHFFHFVTISALPVAIVMIISLIFPYIDKFIIKSDPSFATDPRALGTFWVLLLGLPYLMVVLNIIIGFIVQLIIWLIKNNPQVENKFLLHNKYYNIFWKMERF